MDLFHLSKIRPHKNLLGFLSPLGPPIPPQPEDPTCLTLGASQTPQQNPLKASGHSSLSLYDKQHLVTQGSDSPCEGQN